MTNIYINQERDATPTSYIIQWSYTFQLASNGQGTPTSYRKSGLMFALNMPKCHC